MGVQSETVTPDLRRAAESAAERFGVNSGWLNGAPKCSLCRCPQTFKPCSSEAAARLRPKRQIPARHELLAARSNDSEDVVLLLRETGIRSEKEQHDPIETASGGRPVSMTATLRASEHLAEARG